MGERRLRETLSPWARLDGRARLASRYGTGSDVRPVVQFPLLPWLVVTYDEVQRLPLDSRAGFVISLVDGAVELREPE